jgi:acetate kinase
MLGLSGVSSDFRDLGDGMEAGNERCRIALDVFAYNVKKFVGAYAFAMGGLDAIAFTAGIGENNAYVRGLSMENLEALGIEIDAEKNKARGQEIKISTDSSKIQVWVVPTDEELAIARESVALLS